MVEVDDIFPCGQFPMRKFGYPLRMIDFSICFFSKWVENQAEFIICPDCSTTTSSDSAWNSQVA
jgi:hypothetical protein